MARRDRELVSQLESGEPMLATTMLSGSRDFSSDTPDRGLTAVLTDRRVLFFTQDRQRQIHWWVLLSEIASVETDMHWQRGFINKGRETTMVLNLRNGDQFVGITAHVVESKRRIDRFIVELQDAVTRAGQDRPGW